MEHRSRATILAWRHPPVVSLPYILLQVLHEALEGLVDLRKAHAATIRPQNMQTTICSSRTATAAQAKWPQHLTKGGMFATGLSSVDQTLEMHSL